jgi:hypothetical protein
MFPDMQRHALEETFETSNYDIHTTNCSLNTLNTLPKSFGSMLQLLSMQWKC